MRLYSPAKLNLFFRVLNKRLDGFHEIASLMQAISICDTLQFDLANEDSLTCSDPNLPTDQRNFIDKARTLFREKTGFKHPVAIHAEKEIPAEGGLGGGSGNIATTLYALNQLSGLSVKEQTLAEWAGEISSDAPFFFSYGTAYATGRGEKVERLDSLPEIEFYLAKPGGAGLSTPLVYKHCKPNINPSDPKDLLRERKWGINDLEYPAFLLRPDLMQLKRGLMDLGFDTAGMTGSGTSFFCLGKVENPILPNVQFWKASFLRRKTGQWYSEIFQYF